jgi:hypothetical protein
MLIRLSLNCAEFKLIEAKVSTNAKGDIKLKELLLNCAKSKLNQAIVNSKAKLDSKLK